MQCVCDSGWLPRLKLNMLLWCTLIVCAACGNGTILPYRHLDAVGRCPGSPDRPTLNSNAMRSFAKGSVMDLEANLAQSVANVQRHFAHEIRYPDPAIFGIGQAYPSTMATHCYDAVVLTQIPKLIMNIGDIWGGLENQRIHDDQQLSHVRRSDLCQVHVKAPGRFNA